MKILFFGTPVFAEIVLEKLLKSKHTVVGVVCQTDKPSGRGKKFVSPHIVSIAKENDIKVYQFEKLKENVEEFKKIDCDIFVTASYGKIIPKEVLDLKLCINVHPSLLPKFRGATPIQSALLFGLEETGVTIMKTEVGMDDGDIILQKKHPILQEDDYLTLMPKLAELGAELLLQALADIESGKFKRVKQNNKEASVVRPIKKEDGLLNFSSSAETLVNAIRAYVEFPTAYFFLGGDRIKVQKAATSEVKLRKGEVYHNKKEFLIGCGMGTLKILRCQVSGGKELNVSDFLNGYHFKAEKVDV